MSIPGPQVALVWLNSAAPALALGATRLADRLASLAFPRATLSRSPRGARVARISGGLGLRAVLRWGDAGVGRLGGSLLSRAA